MIIAIASNGNSLTAKIDSHFARCSYFALYDTETSDLDFIKNHCRTLGTNVGLAAVECLAAENVKKVISGEFGIKVKEELEKHSIQLIVVPDHSKTIEEIVSLLKSNKSN